MRLNFVPLLHFLRERERKREREIGGGKVMLNVLGS